ncbi:MFS transporter [Oceanobacillus profundus]|uniref:MFS transporter n=1 Tax=Oceanobacillus profundus TaxID=372463 RepID=A0A417YQ09_9BACI|nr:MFS transporter [Oceanobacillus profundus]MBR3120327.1 MFS transporter [Oceanobacillus sp.]PAE30684.1 MFS transporter [Paenibacillus sp. 7884-2]MCM3398774.1 MFS transporter [Oceanobacillus profundus]MDO6450152.1 MFS transporter [Oceanobacillus profundus]RHW35643.1 MFS transporter [Oceanobacillus profundus]
MWFANFFVSGSMTMVIPFISLYINSMGNFSDSYVQTWSGLTFAVTFIAAFIFSPIWGRIGDKYGRKNILIISAFGIGLSVFLMGFATSVWQLFLLRLFMGIVTGFIPMSQAFISVQTPKEVAGKVLGTLQTGSITGALMGPMLGGALADIFGYSSTFKWVSITIFISGFLVMFGIKELQINISNDKNDFKSYSSKEVLQHILSRPVLLVVMLLSTLVQIAHFSIQPILSLFVAEIHGPVNIAFFAGLAFSAAGLGNLLMSRRWGKIGDRIGYIKILIILLFMAGIVYFPGAFVTNIWQLVVLRFLLGVSIGGIVPLRIAYIRQEAPLSMQGEVLGYNTSLRFLGNIIGPALGGIIAATWGFSSVFLITSLLLIASGVIMLVAWYKSENSPKQAHSFSSR